MKKWRLVTLTKQERLRWLNMGLLVCFPAREAAHRPAVESKPFHRLKEIGQPPFDDVQTSAARSPHSPRRSFTYRDGRCGSSGCLLSQRYYYYCDGAKIEGAKGTR